MYWQVMYPHNCVESCHTPLYFVIYFSIDGIPLALNSESESEVCFSNQDSEEQSAKKVHIRNNREDPPRRREAFVKCSLRG